MSWSDTLGTDVVPVDMGAPKVWNLPKFDGYSDPKKMEVIERIAENGSRDPRIATLAVDILRQYGVAPRDYRGQLAALLAWVQDNIYYVNEQDERLQDPLYTLKVKYGDCDDEAILLMALVKSLRLPARPVISGVTADHRKVRYIRGQPGQPEKARWSHIYVQVGDQPYGQNVTWYFAEPTLKVPLGWDVVSGDSRYLPEMSGAAGTAGGAAAAGAIAANPHLDDEQFLGLNWKSIAVAVTIGTLVATLTQLSVDYVKSRWEFSS